jgi:hypothetical protein
MVICQPVADPEILRDRHTLLEPGGGPTPGRLGFLPDGFPQAVRRRQVSGPIQPGWPAPIRTRSNFENPRSQPDHPSPG